MRSVLLSAALLLAISCADAPRRERLSSASAGGEAPGAGGDDGAEPTAGSAGTGSGIGAGDSAGDGGTGGKPSDTAGTGGTSYEVGGAPAAGSGGTGAPAPRCDEVPECATVAAPCVSESIYDCATCDLRVFTCGEAHGLYTTDGHSILCTNENEEECSTWGGAQIGRCCSLGGGAGGAGGTNGSGGSAGGSGCSSSTLWVECTNGSSAETVVCCSGGTCEVGYRMTDGQEFPCGVEPVDCSCAAKAVNLACLGIGELCP